jgi:hypothetical protein
MKPDVAQPNLATTSSLEEASRNIIFEQHLAQAVFQMSVWDEFLSECNARYAERATKCRKNSRTNQLRSSDRY